MSKLSDFITRHPPPPPGSPPGSWQYVPENPAPVWIPDKPPEPRRDLPAWITAIGTAVIALGTIALFILAVWASQAG